MIRRLVLVACLGTARAAGFSQSLVEQPDVSAETYMSDTGAACPMPNMPEYCTHTALLCQDVPKPSTTPLTRACAPCSAAYVTWTPFTTSGALPSANHGFTTALDPVNQHMLLFGGCTDATVRGTCPSTMSILNLETNTWRHIEGLGEDERVTRQVSDGQHVVTLSSLRRRF